MDANDPKRELPRKFKARPKLAGADRRQQMLARTFKMYVAWRLHSADDFHEFCHFAKEKGESELLRYLRQFGTDPSKKQP